MGNAIETNYECMSCGNVITLKQVLTTNQKKSKYAFESPKACVCGNKDSTNMNLFSFRQMESIIVSKEDMKKISDIIDKEGVNE